MMDTSITDTHVHLWNPDRLHYAWHAAEPQLARPFLLDDYRAACADANVQRVVFLECDCDPDQIHDEVAMITELAAVEPRLQGIVAQAPLENGDAVRDDLDALAANPLVKGIRRITQAEPDPDFCNRPGFVRGVQLLADFDLTCDLCINASQLNNTTRLVQSCPGVEFILDHIGKPDIRNAAFQPWATELRKLAALPNVVCKLSGVITEADHDTWCYADVQPYMQHAIDCFGPDRIIYGGDWPVLTLAATYTQWQECVQLFLAPLTIDERRQIMHDNAAAFYRL